MGLDARKAPLSWNADFFQAGLWARLAAQLNPGRRDRAARSSPQRATQKNPAAADHPFVGAILVTET